MAVQYTIILQYTLWKFVVVVVADVFVVVVVLLLLNKQTEDISNVYRFYQI